MLSAKVKRCFSVASNWTFIVKTAAVHKWCSKYLPECCKWTFLGLKVQYPVRDMRYLLVYDWCSRITILLLQSVLWGFYWWHVFNCDKSYDEFLCISAGGSDVPAWWRWLLHAHCGTYSAILRPCSDASHSQMGQPTASTPHTADWWVFAWLVTTLVTNVHLYTGETQVAQSGHQYPIALIVLINS